MSIQSPFKYSDLFDGPRPEIKSILENIPSIFIIRFLAFINDVLSVKGDNISSQIFIFDALTADLSDEIKEDFSIRKIRLKLESGSVLFALFYSTEFVNRELIYFKPYLGPSERDTSDVLHKFLKAYTIIIDEINEQDELRYADSIEDAKKGGDENLMKLMWPHFIRQMEFSTHSKPSPPPLYEICRSFAFSAYLEQHPKYATYAKPYFQSLGCDNGLKYIFRILGIVVAHLRRPASDSPQNYFLTVTTNEENPMVESLVVDPAEIKNDLKKQLDYRGQKEKPFFKIKDNEYVVANWNYVYNSMFSGLVFAFYYNSKVNEVEKSFGDFKGALGLEFSEEILFKGIMKKCFSKEHESLAFFDINGDFTPDCYYRTGNHIFIIEFKDSLLNSDIIQSGSYDKIKESIDKKFVTVKDTKKGKVSDKGIYQLARNIEDLAQNPKLFWSIDTKAEIQQMNLKDIIIHPIIVQTNPYFDLPGINDYLDGLIQTRLNPIKSSFKEIAPFTIINFKFFFERLLMFADAKIELASELEYYHQTILNLKIKTNETGNEDDWFNSKKPISIFSSPAYRQNLGYRDSDFQIELNKCWRIEFKE